MISNTKRSVHNRHFLFQRHGFTLVEALTVVLIIGIMAGTLGVVYRGLSARSQSPEREAQKLSRWLTNLVTISNRTGRPFLLNCPGNVMRNHIVVTWQNPLQRVIYTSAYGSGFRRHSGTSVESLYSPQWTAMVPTITIRVSRGNVNHYVIVSQSGRVRTSSLPPRQ